MLYSSTIDTFGVFPEKYNTFISVESSRKSLYFSGIDVFYSFSEKYNHYIDPAFNLKFPATIVRSDPVLRTLRHRCMNTAVHRHDTLQRLRKQPLCLHEPPSDIVIPQRVRACKIASLSVKYNHNKVNHY